MTKIEWNEGLSLGLEKIDRQHKHLIDLANSLLAATHRMATAEIHKIFHQFREYTVYHFNEEEEYMKSIKYPKLEDHQRQHIDLKNQVKQFQDTIYRHGTIPEEEILEFLRNWLINHIIQSDLAIKDFLAKKNSEAKTQN